MATFFLFLGGSVLGCLFFKIERMRRCEKRTFYRLARSEQMSGSELQKKSVPKDEQFTIQKKKFQMF